ncbi:MAG: DNA-directed RNA polymerase subunit alpha [Candidatus Omnitrophica bacterium]|nr:DNA-directed RNA polymerase subunit alpha [Candidatus Omnitrophota bacterium]
MGTRWRDFEMPNRLICDEASLTTDYGKFIAEPLERGYGTTIGNSLRRVLLSSIEGAAVTQVKFDKALHEFTSVPGVVEDVTHIILNIKQLVLKYNGKGPKDIKIKAGKKGNVTAADIQTDKSVEVVNKDLHIATLAKAGKLNIEMRVDRGRGYLPAERNKKDNQAIGVIPIDAIFTPVIKVNYRVEETRVGQMTDYDKLIMEIWTNGSISPKDALTFASYTLQKYMDIFVKCGEIPEEEEIEEVDEKQEEIQRFLAKPVSELELSVRSGNCLRNAKIQSIGELVKKTETDMLKYRNFGRKSLDEIQNMIKKMGLSFGMDIERAGKVLNIAKIKED